VSWASGASTRVGRGKYPWSVSGIRGPQPDGGDREECIMAVNISFWKDGSRLHDMGCDHREPVLCE